jgi:hypothetical protein
MILHIFSNYTSDFGRLLKKRPDHIVVLRLEIQAGDRSMYKYQKPHENKPK